MEWDRDNATTQAATATQVGTVIFVFFPLASSTHSSYFWLALFHRVQRQAERDVAWPTLASKVTRYGGTTCTFSVLLLFFFSSFLLLALLLGHLLFREVDFKWPQGGQQRFDWQRGGQQCIIRALLGRSGVMGTCSVIFRSLFSSTH